MNSDIVSDSTRVAAIDCGTNSIRLLIADRVCSATGVELCDVQRHMRIVRLGQGVDATGSFTADAVERTRIALVEYAGLMRHYGVDKVRMVATSATRDAANRDVFFDMAEQVLGSVIPGSHAEVISGEQEAELSFHGAVSGLDSADGPFVVVDLGGGSTEVVLGNGVHEGVLSSFSADIGCVRVTERCLHSDPPTEAEVTAARQFVRQRLDEALHAVPIDHACTWVGVAGTFTTIAALAAQMTTYDPAVIHLLQVPSARLMQVCAEVLGMTRQQRVALGPMHAGRVDVIGGGAIIVQELVSLLGQRAGIDTLIVSEHDILDGIALSVGEN